MQETLGAMKFMALNGVNYKMG